MSRPAASASRLRKIERSGGAAPAVTIATAAAILMVMALPAGAAGGSIQSMADNRAADIASPIPLGTADLGAGEIVFSSSGDLWTVDRTGGDARSLTSGPAWDDNPVISPDGSTIAFTRDSGSGRDLYVLPAPGGEPRRLTWHPKEEVPRDWSADGRRILFSSNREGDGLWRLYTIGLDDPWEDPLPLPRGSQASWSPDGRRLACTELGRFAGWLRYKGGAAGRICIVDMATGARVTIPHNEYADWQPIWMGDSIYFLSERDGTENLYVGDPAGRRVRPVTRFRTFGARSAASGPGGIVMVRHGGLWVHSALTGKTEQVPVRLPRIEWEHLKPARASVAEYASEFTLSPEGWRILMAARGDIFLVEVSDGRSVNLTASPGVADRLPAMSPNGRRVAWFSDQSGEYLLNVAEVVDDDGAGASGGAPAGGSGAVHAAPGNDVPPAYAPRLERQKPISIGAVPSFYTQPVWSPDARHLVTSDKHQRLWIVDVEAGSSEQLDRSALAGEDDFQATFSPDGHRVAWSRHLESSIAAVFVRQVDGGPVLRVSPELEHCEAPVFSADSSILYMTRSTMAPAAETFGMSALPYRGLVTRQILAVSLDGREARSDGRNVRVIRTDPGNYTGLARGHGNALLVQLNVTPADPLAGRTERKLLRLDPAGGPAVTLAEGISSWSVSGDGTTVLVQNRKGIQMAGTDSAGALRSVSLDSLFATVDRRAEWAQIYHEAWRIVRDYFYDPGCHGQDLAALEKEYSPRLPGLVQRRDLNDLMLEMLGHISVSHLDAYGGDEGADAGHGPMVGLPGADFERVGDHVRVRRVLHGDNLTSLTTSPLAQADVAARPGEWLLAVNGIPVTASKNVYSFFEVSSPAPIDVTLGPDSTGAGSRTVKVRLLPGENTLRRLDWGEANRRMVDSLSAGKLGYIYLPDTGVRGFQGFVRGFFGQMDRKGLVIDERFNSGGAPADLIVEMLARKGLSAYTFRDGADTPFPTTVFEGPRVMIINESAGSGGDTLPWMFRRAGLGLLVGTRTMGAGIGGFVRIPSFIDGGQLDMPNRGFYNPDGTWDIENSGVPPDIQVEWTPADYRRGHDTQLERAVAEALAALHRAGDHPLRRRPAPVRDLTRPGGAERSGR